MTNAPTILIVDDQAEVREIYARALEKAGYRVHVAGTAEAAMQIVEDSTPGAVLLDLAMPFINGMGLLYRLRKRHPRLPVAIVTGSTNLEIETIAEIGELGAAIHFKPLSIAQLYQMVEDLLRKSDA